VIIGVPREIKSGEQRVALTPPGVRALTQAGHRVVVERGAGTGSSIRDEEYEREGATLAPGAASPCRRARPT
jgi:alanine dehydrogenase